MCLFIRKYFDNCVLMTSLFMHYSQIEHILVSDDDITMDVIIYDSTLHGRPSQISGIWRWKISFLQTMMTVCLICDKKNESVISLLLYKETLFIVFFIIGCSFSNCYCIIYRIMISAESFHICISYGIPILWRYILLY